MSAIHSLTDLLVHELSDLHSAESQLIEALPTMIEGAGNKKLSMALTEHLKVTKAQLQRLDEVFAKLGEKPGSETCLGMKGLIAEGNRLFNKGTVIDQPQLDAAIIAAAQRVEHYEIAAYGTVCAFARQLGLSEIESLMKLTLSEESAADETLSSIAMGEVNLKAQTAEAGG